MTLGAHIDTLGAPRLIPFERRHLVQLRAIVASSPAMNVHVGATLARRSFRHPTHDLWTLLVGDEIVAAFHRGRGVSWAIDREAAQHPGVLIALAEFISRRPGHQEVIFGPEAEVEGVMESCRWHGLDPMEIRRQEMMVCPDPLPVEQFPPRGDYLLRSATRSDLRYLLTSHAAMCREDLGIDQVARNPEGYQRYFGDLVRKGRCLVIEHEGKLVGKADIPLVSEQAMLIEGVYSDPKVRGLGLITRMMAEIAKNARERLRVACLYVHRRNARAIGVYRRVGFQTVCPWVTAILGHHRGKRSAPVEW